MSSRSRILGLAFCLLVIVLGCRWAAVGRYGTDVPEMDEWDAIGLSLIVPWTHHALHPAAFWEAHVDHRIPFTRALMFTELRLNGQWDQRIEAMVNAAFAAAIAAGLWLAAERHLRRGQSLALFLLLVVLHGVPFATDNVLRGFHSPQFLLTGCALVAIGFLPSSPPGSRRWWLGAAAAWLSLGTLASGVLAAAVAGGLAGLRLLRPARRKDAAFTLLVCGAVIVAAWLTRPPKMYGIAALKARSLAEFLSTLEQSLGWPAHRAGFGCGSLLLFLPWTLVAARVARPRAIGDDPWAEFLAGAGLWSLLQQVAAAYARGWGGLPPPTRYIDNIELGLVINALCLAWLLRAAPRGDDRRPVLSALAGLWAGLLLVGLAGESAALRPALEDTRTGHARMTANVREYLKTGDVRALRPPDIPYLTPATLQERLDSAELRPFLPASVRADGVPAPAGSRLAAGLGRLGPFVALAAALVAGLLMAAPPRRMAA